MDGSLVGGAGMLSHGVFLQFQNFNLLHLNFNKCIFFSITSITSAPSLVFFNFVLGKVCSPAIIETYFFCDKYIWVAVTDYYMYLYLIMLFLLLAVLQLINFHNLQTFSLLNVIFL